VTRCLVGCFVAVCAILPERAYAQLVSQRGFADLRGQVFPRDAPNDPTQGVADLLLREEAFAKPFPWLQLAGGVEFRANSHDQVEDEWRIDVRDRGVERPRLSLRRASATITRGRFTVDLGKQFIRWGKTDILNPTDRFAPRDFLNVIDSEFLSVTGVRGVAQLRKNQDSVEVVWLPAFTPSRIPLLDQRWVGIPARTATVPLVDAGAIFTHKSQSGIRWSHLGDRLEYSASFFDGVNHLPSFDTAVRLTPVGPEVDITRVFPAIRAYGGDLTVPTHWLTLKGEIAYFTSRVPTVDEYVLYVVQLERQTGEWVFVGGYAGQAVTRQRSALSFAPDRGLTRAAVGRASWTIGPTRSLGVEAAIRQDLSGAYGKAEYSETYGQHWRATVAGVAVGGEPDDFLGQYRRNSHFSLALRYSF
jgi:hypothetical protein